jgi:hypothetical protein
MNSINNISSLYGNYEVSQINFSKLKDWGFSFIYGPEFSSSVNLNIYSIAVEKRFSNHILSLRYTPGYQKEFNFNTASAIILSDSTRQSLSSKFSYKELFGLGYYFRFSDELQAGFNLRYFSQEFSREIISPVIADTIYLVRENQSEKLGLWKGELGFNYSSSQYFSAGISSINLFSFSEDPFDQELEKFKLKTEKGVMLNFNFSPLRTFGLNGIIESNKSFQIGVNGSITFSNSSVGIGCSIFHDKTQSPFIAGVIPSVNFSTSFLSVSLSGIKYFSDRKDYFSYGDFENNGITNVINNPYSFDKALLTIAFALNTIQEKKVEFADVKIIEDIYPAFTENYLNKPFAVATVVNVSDERVNVKPFSRINGLSEDLIYSPIISINPGDTATISYFTVIPENYAKTKSEVSTADFYILTSNEEFDDQIQKPVLVNGVNSWDGDVINLNYFIKKSFDFSISYSKKILSNNKTLFDTLENRLSNFYKTKLIYNSFAEALVYVSDPRASSEYVQYPEETFTLKGGDCDDLSVCLSSLLESVGVATALVDYQLGELRHVNLLINTKLSPSEAGLITSNENKYLIRKNNLGNDEIWIPLEATSLKRFEDSWQAGAEKFNKDALENYGLSRGSVQIIDVY